MPETPNFVQLVPGGHGFAKIDDEIEARKNAKIALEQAAISQTAREMAIFDTVFDNLDKKETK